MNLCKRFLDALHGAAVTAQYMAVHEVLCPDCAKKSWEALHEKGLGVTPKGPLELYFDGANEPVNPGGIATYGFVVKRSGALLRVEKGLAAEAGSDGSTNNVAEYMALLKGLEGVRAHLVGGDVLVVRGDSQLVVRQLSGEYACNAALLRPLLAKASLAIRELTDLGVGVHVQWIHREENFEADRLSKEAVKDAIQADPGILDRVVLRYGKHLGKKLSEVPSSYRDWLWNKGS